MVKYIILFTKPVRICLDIVESIGPFNSLDDVHKYNEEHMSKWAIVPDCKVITILSPED